MKTRSIIRKTQKDPVPVTHKHHTEEAAAVAGEIAGGWPMKDLDDAERAAKSEA